MLREINRREKGEEKNFSSNPANRFLSSFLCSLIDMISVIARTFIFIVFLSRFKAFSRFSFYGFLPSLILSNSTLFCCVHLLRSPPIVHMCVVRATEWDECG